MSVSFFNEDVDMPNLNVSSIKKWIIKIINNQEKITGNINYIFCSDLYLLEINKKYLNHDYFTDIVTFDYCEDEIVSGDIFISVDRVAENSEIYKSGNTELYRVIVHGILHLLGFNDSSIEEQTEMRAKEDECIEMLNPCT
jgi:probable rRNA maturation factor